MEKEKRRGLMKSFRFMTKARSDKDALSRVLSSLDEDVEKIKKELQRISEGIHLTFNQKSMQYKSSDELWRYYKYVRDQHNYLLAYFTLITFERSLKEWQLAKRVDPLSPYFKEFKKSKARYKRLKDEINVCHKGILYDLLGRCLSEKIYLAEPVSGAAEPSPKPTGSPSGKYIKSKFTEEFDLTFDPVQFCKLHNLTPLLPHDKKKILKTSPDESELKIALELSDFKNTDDDIVSPNWYKFTKSKKKITENRVVQKKKSLRGQSKTGLLKLKMAISTNMLDCEFNNKNISIERKLCKIFRVRSDNHGMFRALAFSMALGNTTVQQESRAIYKLRELTCNELLRSSEEPFMSDGTTVKQMMVKKSSLNMEEVGLVNVVCDYYRKMLFRKKPGSLELWALSRALERRITVFEKVILDKTRKQYATYFKHSASYGMSFGDEVCLYKNGKGEYASLLKEAPAPNEPSDYTSLLFPTDDKKRSLDRKSNLELAAELEGIGDGEEGDFDDILNDNSSMQAQEPRSHNEEPIGSGMESRKETNIHYEQENAYLDEDLFVTPPRQLPSQNAPAHSVDVDF